MRPGRSIALVVLSALAAACGGDDGIPLEEWVAEADEICADADEAADDLELETPEDIADRGEEAVDIAREAIDDIEALQRPGGEDEEVADDLIDAFAVILEVQEAVIDEVGDGEDELALVSIALDYEDGFDEGFDAAEAADSDECADTFEERQDSIQAVKDLFEEVGDLADVRVGDCLTGVDDEDTLAPADCDGDEAEGEVVSTIISAAARGCAEGSDLVSASGVSFCVESFGPPPEEDGVLEIGSCILLENAAGDSVDVSEFSCEDLAVTHEVSGSVSDTEACLRRERRFAKSEAEIELSGPGEWCARRL